MKKYFQFGFSSFVLLAILLAGATTALAASTFQSVSVGSQLRSVYAGTASSTAYTVTVNRTGSGNLDIALSLFGTLPTGATASFSPSTVSFTGNTPTSATSTLTINTSASTPVGSKTFKVKGFDGDDETKFSASSTITVSSLPAPTLTITKIVVNNNGGTKVVSDFPLFLDGARVTSGVATTTTAGNHTVSETSDSNYSVTIICNGIATSTISLTQGDNKSCTITNDDKPGAIVITKNAVGGNGTFSFTTTGTGFSNFAIATAESSTSTFSALSIGSYTVTENENPSGWDFTSLDCVDPSENTNISSSTANINLTFGETVTCTYTNTKRATIIVSKDVVSPSGSAVSDSHSFTVHKGSDEGMSIAEGSPVTYSNLLPGTYTITEDADSNYDFDSFSVDNDSETAGAQITVTPGQVVNLTVTNKQKRGSLRVVKVVSNQVSGTSVPSDFTMNVTGSSTSQSSFPGNSEGTTITLDPGQYSVSEGAHEGYAMSQSEGCSGVMTSNGSATCTVTNSDIPAGQGAITVIKNVINDNGGTATAASFSLKITQPAVSHHNENNEGDEEGDEEEVRPIVTTVASGQANYLEPKTYIISEASSTLPYTQTGIVCRNGETETNGTVTLGAQQAWVCTITNDDLPGTLHIVKNVINDNGGNKIASNFNFSINSGSSTAFESDGQNDVSVNAGTYTIREGEVEGYETTYTGCEEVSVTNGGEATCTITNNDKPAHLTIIKRTDEFSGNGSFNFYVLGTGESSFRQSVSLTTTDLMATSESITLNAGSYDVTESVEEGGWHLAGVNCQYDGESIGESLPLGGEHITVDSGDSVTCTFTNTKKGTLIVKKVVINDNGGAKRAGDFSFTLGDNEESRPISFIQQEDSARGENSLVLFPGRYSILETPATGYTTTYDNCSGVSVVAGSSTVCTITNNDIAPAVTEPQVVNGPTGGGNIIGGGQVLGASTDDGNSCSVLLTDYMRYGQKNNSVQVTKLQTFLNSQNLGVTLVVNGIFDRATENAVKAFQLKYSEEILAPWVKAGRIKNKVATGYVYKTTLRWINHLNCSKNPLPPISL